MAGKYGSTLGGQQYGRAVAAGGGTSKKQVASGYRKLGGGVPYSSPKKKTSTFQFPGGFGGWRS